MEMEMEMEMEMIEKPSISDLLALAGYSHERNSGSATTGEHRIWNTATGEIVGYMTAHAAVEFLDSLKTAKAT